MPNFRATRVGISHARITTDRQRFLAQAGLARPGKRVVGSRVPPMGILRHSWASGTEGPAPFARCLGHECSIVQHGLGQRGSGPGTSKANDSAAVAFPLILSSTEWIPG